MKHYIQFNPMRTLAALAVFLHAVVALVAYTYTWDAQLIVLVDGTVTGFLAVFGTLFVEAKSSSNAALQALQAAQDALDNDL